MSTSTLLDLDDFVPKDYVPPENNTPHPLSDPGVRNILETLPQIVTQSVNFPLAPQCALIMASMRRRLHDNLHLYFGQIMGMNPDDVPSLRSLLKNVASLDKKISQVEAILGMDVHPTVNYPKVYQLMLEYTTTVLGVEKHLAYLISSTLTTSLLSPHSKSTKSTLANIEDSLKSVFNHIHSEHEDRLSLGSYLYYLVRSNDPIPYDISEGEGLDKMKEVMLEKMKVKELEDKGKKKDEKIMTLEDRVKELKEERDKARLGGSEQLEILNTNNASLEALVSSLRKEIQEVKTSKEGLQNSVEEMSTKIQELTKEKDSSYDELQRLRKVEVDLTGCTDQLNQTSTDLEKAMSEKQNLEEKYTTDQQKWEKEKQSLEATLKWAQEELNKSANIKDLEDSISTLKSQLAQSSQKHLDEINKKNEELDSLQKKLNDSSSETTQLEQNLKILKDGYEKDVKELKDKVGSR